MNDLPATRLQAATKANQNAEAALRLPRPGQRIDLGLASVIAGLAALGGLGAYALAGWLDVSGLLDPPLPVEVDDPRILTDYRDAPSPMVDMVTLGDDLLIGRRDGRVDRFDMNLRTFAAETLPRGGALSGDLDLLSVDCAPGGCETGTEDRAFAVTDKGGLAQRTSGGWQVVLGDMAFIGLDGLPVEQADLRGWAISDDGALVLADAGTKGLGLFDQRDGSWRTGPAIADVTQGPLFFADSFWLGSPSGLHRIAPANARSGGAPTDWGGTPVPGTEGTILDLTLQGREGLLILRSGTCTGGGAGCLSVLEMSRANRLTPLLQEIEANPDLSDSGFIHAVMQVGDLITLGQAGVHRYDADQRHWLLIDPQPPTAHFAEAEGARLHVALPDRVITFSGGMVLREVPLKAPLVQILPGRGNELYGLDRMGQILDVSSGEPKLLLAADTGAPADARFTGAVAMGDAFLALGPQGILLHDVTSRRYSFVPAQSLPALPLGDAILVPGGAQRLWLVARGSGEVWSLAPEGEFPAKTVTAQALGGPGVAVVQARAEGVALMLIGSQGEIYRLQPDGQIETWTGEPLQSRLAPVAVAAQQDEYLLTDGRKLWLYRMLARGWFGPVSAPPGSTLTDVAMTAQEMLALDGDGMVHLLTDDGWLPVSGGFERASFGLDTLQDATAAAGTLFLASDGQVQSYLPAERRFDVTWRKPGRGAEILAIEAGVPLWTNTGGVYRGDSDVYSGPEFIDGWLGATGPVALGRGPGGSLYLAGQQGCLFSGAPAPQGEMRDVVLLDGSRLLVVTERGAGIYEPELHRWLAASVPGLRSDSRLMRLGGHLVMLAPDAVASVPIQAIPQVASCDRAPVRIEWSVNEGTGATSLVDGRPEVLMLSANGLLRRWQDGKIDRENLPAGEAPVMAQVLRAYPSGDGIEMLTASAWWHYDTGARSWLKHAFEGAPADVAQIDMQPDGEGRVLTIWDSQGQPWVARWKLRKDPITFAAQRRPILPEIPVPPTEIRDIAALGNRTVVLTDTRLLIYVRDRTEAFIDLSLPAPQQEWHLATDATDALILTDGNTPAATSIHRIDPAAGGRGDLSTSAAHYLPRDDLAHVFTRDGGSDVSGTFNEVRLLRIDSAMNSWRCRVVTGAEPDCALLVGPPMPLDADQILAYAPGPRLLLTPDALWQLDEAARPRLRIEGLDLRPEGQLLGNGGSYLYWEGPGRALWRLAGGMAEKLHDRVDALRPIGSSFAALADGRVTEVRAGQFVAPPLPAEHAAETLRFGHFTPEGEVWVTDSGRVIAKFGALVSDPLLVFAPDAGAILPLPDATGTQRWLEALPNGTLRLRFVGTCEVPAPLPPAPPPEFIGPIQPPEPLPPTIEPCAKEQALPVALEAGEQLMAIRRDSSGWTLQTGTRDIALDNDLAAVTGEAPAALARTTGEFLKARPVGGTKMVGGRSYLNPPLFDANRLWGGERALEFDPRPTTALPAFDAGWLSWQRGPGSFRFSADPAPVEMTPDEAIQGGRFLPMAEARALALPGGGVAWLTPSGLWHQTGTGMSPVALSAQSLPLAIDEGRFVWTGGGLQAQDGSATGTPQRGFTLGGLEIAVDPLTGRIGTWLDVGGRRQDDLAVQGFLHDQRLDVAQTGSTTVYLTPIGLIPTLTLTGGSLAAPDTLRLAAEAGHLLAQTASGWLALQTSGWAATPVPFQNATLAQENGRVWERRDGTIRITAPDSWRLARQGLDFDIDQLLGFAATPQAAVAVTRAGTHAAPGIAGLAEVAPPLSGPPGGLPLDARRADPSRHVLYSAAREVWDASARAWRAPNPDERPWEARQAALLDGIALDFTPAPRAAITVLLLGGGEYALPFAWGAGDAMPFDHATALHADGTGGDLLIGTRLGLRRLSPRGTGYDSTPPLLPGDGGKARATSVLAVGRPDATPQRIEIAFSTGDCAEAPDIGMTPSPCTTPQGLATRFVVDTGEWHVTKTDSAVDWGYVIDGIERPLLQPLSGHMPHDLLSDRLTCAGQVVEAWRDAPILRIAGTFHEVGGLSGLYCQPAAAYLGGGQRLEAGLYALTGATALRFDGSGFAPVAAPQVAGLRDRQSGAVVMETGRLSYGLAEGEPLTRYRSLGDAWIDTPWTEGRMVLDQPRALAWRDGLQVITDAGVADAPGGRLDLAGLVIMQGTTPDTLASCQIAGAEMLDGRSHGLKPAPGGPLRLYCSDGSWLQGRTDDSRDVGAFLPEVAKGEERALVSVPGLWSVTSKVGPDGKAQGVSFAFRDEPARLAGGRFDFDAFQALAAPFEGMVDLVTDSGWWRAPVAGLALDATERSTLPLDPRDVEALSADRSRRSGARGLCLQIGGTAQFWSGGAGLENTGLCREDRGQDPLWHWWQEGGLPKAEGIGLNGIALDRKLVAGRFEDLVVTGAPLLGAEGSLLVPTRSGILVIGTEGSGPAGLYVMDGDGALGRAASGVPVWIDRTGAVLLEGETAPIEAAALACPDLLRLTGSLPQGNRLMRLQPQDGWVSASIDSPAYRVQALVDCQDPSRNQVWTSRHDVSGHPRNLALGADRAETVEIALTPEGIVLESGPRKTLVADSRMDRLQALAVDRSGEELFVIEDGRLMSISLAPALGILADMEVAPSRQEPAAPIEPPSAPATLAPAPAEAPAAAAPAPPPEPPAAPAHAAEPTPVPPASAKGAQDEAIYDARAVQRALAKVLGEAITVDGAIGPRSRAAIARWQTGIGAAPTGYLSHHQLVLLLAEAAQ